MSRFERHLCVCALLLAAAAAASGTVLQQLSLAEMAQKSTAVVRARVKSNSSVLRNKLAYTVYALDVRETWKSGPTAVTAVSVPGGTVSGVRQVIDGAPTLIDGQEYVLFLWTGPSGITQITGLSQGLFLIQNGNVATRFASHERMVNARGENVQSTDESMKLAALHDQVASALGRKPQFATQAPGGSK